MNKAPECQMSALKEYNAQRKQTTTARVNEAIDKLKDINAVINFETVAKAAGVSRATLYNDPKLKERIMGLRALSSTPLPESVAESKKTKVQCLEETIVGLKTRIQQLETDKKNLIVQLVDYEEIKAENLRLRQQLLKGVAYEK